MVRDVRRSSVRGHGNVRLEVRETGTRDGPAILFVHGWAQSHLTWKRQLHSDLADRYRLVAFDLRGHGMSQAPDAVEDYSRSRVWADDVAAVIAQIGLMTPLIVGWSHGSFVVCDYLRHYPRADLAGVVLASWAVRIGETEEDRAYIGSGFKDHFEDASSTELAVSIPAMRAFIDACVAVPLAPADRDEMLAYNMMVTPFVRRAAGSHEKCDNHDVLAALQVPLLAIHGDADTVVLPASLELVRAARPDALISLYDGVAHTPCLEDPERFNRELADFAARVFDEAGRPTDETAAAVTSESVGR